MDATRFDAITRSLIAETSRRRALQGVAGGTLAGLLAHLGLVEAKRRCLNPGQNGCFGPKRRKCCRGAICKGGTERTVGRCVCGPGLTKCGTKCIAETQCCTDFDCVTGVDFPEYQICVKGQCVIGQGTCDDGSDVCQGSPSCGANCYCFQTTAGKTRCGNNDFFNFDEGCGTCVNDADCAAVYPNVRGVFCAQGSGGGNCYCQTGTFCMAPCPG